MKRFILLLLVLVSLSAQAQFGYDDGTPTTITELVKNVPENDPEEFWLTLYNKHPQNIAIDYAIKKERKSMMQAVSRFPDMDVLRKLVSSRSVNSDEADELIAKVEGIIKAESTFPAIKFFVVEKDTPNAGMFPDGSGEINSYWLSPDVEIEELVAICCHETAHFVLTHSLRDEWKTVKAKKRNAVLAELGTGFALGVYAGSQINAAQYGVQQSSAAQQQTYENLAKIGVNSYNEGQWYAEFRQRFKYSRESETEADEVAFWFMEKNGIDPMHWINVLKRLEKEEAAMPRATKAQRKTSKHPDIKKRINHIEKLYKKYHLQK